MIARATLPFLQGIPMNKPLRFLLPLIAHIVLFVFWMRLGSSVPDSSLTTDPSDLDHRRDKNHLSADAESPAAGALSSSHREESANHAKENDAISGIEEFTHDDLVYEHVIHTLVPHGSSVVMAGERDANGKRIFTILTPQSGGPEMPAGQIKLSGNTYALDDQQITQAGMQTLLADEKRLHNQGEIWSPEDIKKTQDQWPPDAALSMPTLMLESGSEGMIEIGSLRHAPYLHRTKVQVSSSADGFELKTTLQTFRKPVK